MLYTNTKSRWIKDLNWNFKELEQNVSEYLSNIKAGKSFLSIFINAGTLK